MKTACHLEHDVAWKRFKLGSNYYSMVAWESIKWPLTLLDCIYTVWFPFSFHFLDFSKVKHKLHGLKEESLRTFSLACASWDLLFVSPKHWRFPLVEIKISTNSWANWQQDVRMNIWNVTARLFVCLNVLLAPVSTSFGRGCIS